MSRVFSMAYLTANGLDPVAAVSLAAKVGYDRISFRLLPAGPGDTPPPLMTDDALLAEVVAAMADTGVTMADSELIRLNADTGLERFRPFLERVRLLGARHVLVAGDDRERARLTDSFGRLCPLLAEYGLTADLEFMPWTAVATLADARQIVEAAAHPAAAILFDTLHFDRCGSAPEEITALPPHLLNYVQICDGPVPYDPSDAGLIAVARTARMIPGEGGIDLPALLSRLPAGLPVSVEVPNHALAQKIGVEALARRALEAARALVAP